MEKLQTETGLSFLSRVRSRPSLTDLDGHLFVNGLQPQEIIEINGESDTGKSLLCSHLTITAILPKSWLGAYIGGMDSNVIFIDTDKHFNILHFTNMLERRIKKFCHNYKDTWNSSQSIDNDQPELIKLSKKDLDLKIRTLIEDCLKHLIYLYCKDSHQFCLTLLTLDQITMTNDQVSLIIIDSISAFYWIERVYRADSWKKTEAFYSKIFSKFIEHIKKSNLVAICTKQSLFAHKRNSYLSKMRQAGDELPYEFLGKEWARGVDRRIHLEMLSMAADNENPTYSVGVTSANGLTSLKCTFHEDGIHWIN